jgi:hypothetical protein
VYIVGLPRGEDQSILRVSTGNQETYVSVLNSSPNSAAPVWIAGSSGC